MFCWQFHVDIYPCICLIIPLIIPTIIPKFFHNYPGPEVFRFGKCPKSDRICSIYFYNKPILPDCEVNIAQLALFAQQTGGGGNPPPPMIIK